MILLSQVYTHRQTTCAILHGIICPIGSQYRLYVGTRTNTEQVMVLEGSQGNFVVAKIQATINATVNQGGITADIRS